MAVKKEKKLTVVPPSLQVVTCAECGGKFMRTELIPQQNGTLLCKRCACPHIGGTHEVEVSLLKYDADQNPHWSPFIATMCNDCGKVLDRKPVVKISGSKL